MCIIPGWNSAASICRKEINANFKSIAAFIPAIIVIRII